MPEEFVRLGERNGFPYYFPIGRWDELTDAIKQDIIDKNLNLIRNMSFEDRCKAGYEPEDGYAFGYKKVRVTKSPDGSYDISYYVLERCVYQSYNQEDLETYSWGMSVPAVEKLLRKDLENLKEKLDQAGDNITISLLGKLSCEDFSIDRKEIDQLSKDLKYWLM